MAKSQNSNKPSDATLTKLLEVDSDLATQEAALLAKLNAIQEKRKSLESVIGIFSPTAPSTTTATPAAATPSKASSSTNNIAPSSNAAAPNATAPKTATKKTATEAKQTKQTKQTKATAKKTEEKPARSTKAARKSQNWQQYVRDDFSKISLPEAVTSVLQRKPDTVLGISDIMNAIFYDEMPREARGKAQNRLSNILSTGLKDNKWYRGKTGHYSVSRTAAMADLSA